MAGKMADLCRFVVAALCGPVPGGVSGRARDVESRAIVADYPLLAAPVQEYGRSDTSLGRTVAAISPWGMGRCARRELAIAAWLRRWRATDASNRRSISCGGRFPLRTLEGRTQLPKSSRIPYDKTART